MAIISSNNLGRLKKKSGPNVFRKWRNLQVMAVYTSEVRNPRTNAQVLNRIRMAGASQIARAYSAAVKIGFEMLCAGTKIPQRSMFIKKNIGHITPDISGSNTFDYEDFVIAEGGLPEVRFGNATYNNPLQVDVPITDDASEYGADLHDDAYVFVFSPEAGSGILKKGKRSDVTIAVEVPAHWNGHRVHVYGFGKGADTNDINPKVLSVSRYLGSGTIS